MLFYFASLIIMHPFKHHLNFNLLGYILNPNLYVRHKIKPDIRSFTYDELADFIKNSNLPKFRAEQIFKWLHCGVDNFDDMTNLSKELRLQLSEICEIYTVRIYKKFVDKKTVL